VLGHGLAKYTKSRTIAQARRDKRALAILRDKGLYAGKVDLRKRPTAYQRSLIAKYDTVVKGKAAVVEPARPADYRDLYQTKGRKVIVPRQKGERITVDKSGEIVSKRKTRGGRIKTRHVWAGEVLEKGPPKNRVVTYAVPFKGKGGKIYYRRFSKQNWKSFRQAYGIKGGKLRDWNEKIIEEEFRFDDLTARERFEAGIDSQLMGEPIKASDVKRKRK